MKPCIAQSYVLLTNGSSCGAAVPICWATLHTGCVIFF